MAARLEEVGVVLVLAVERKVTSVVGVVIFETFSPPTSGRSLARHSTGRNGGDSSENGDESLECEHGGRICGESRLSVSRSWIDGSRRLEGRSKDGVWEENDFLNESEGKGDLTRV